MEETESAGAMDEEVDDMIEEVIAEIGKAVNFDLQTLKYPTSQHPSRGGRVNEKYIL